MLKRICTICGRTVEAGKPCGCMAASRKEYDTAHRNKESAAFYHSKQWKAVQQLVAARAHYADELISFEEGRIVPGRIAHHIQPIADRPELSLSLSNIIYVSDATHKRIHDAYSKGAKERREMQERLARVRSGGT